MTTDTDEDTERTELRDRAILPVLIPVVAIVLVEILVFSYSRVLLATGELKAVGFALAAALAILLGAAAIAAADRMRTASVVGLLVIVGLAVVIGGAVAAKKGPFWGNEPAQSALPGFDLSAKNVAFSTKAMSLPATNAVIKFSNQDNQPHNVAIFKSSKDLSTPLFRGTIAQPGTTEIYKVGTLAAGTYYFHCDVHPTQMFGTVTVK
jgi:plastocyanin